MYAAQNVMMSCATSSGRRPAATCIARGLSRKAESSGEPRALVVCAFSLPMTVFVFTMWASTLATSATPVVTAATWSLRRSAMSSVALRAATDAVRGASILRFRSRMSFCVLAWGLPPSSCWASGGILA